MRMLKAKHPVIGLAGIILLAICTAPRGWCANSSNTTDPLLDLFIKKGFVTQKEAEQVEAEAQAMRTNETQMPPVPPSGWKISKAFKKVELFGDVRLRYEDRSAEDAGNNRIDLQRYRYSVRVGLRGDLFDNFYYGFRLDTSDNPRSAFVTLGTSSSSSKVYQGPFGKSNGGINIGQVYLGWRPWNWLDVTVGKMPNPLYTTPMVWNGNINPEGFAERFKYTIGRADFFATFGQFLYQDVNPSTASSGLGINGLTGQKTDNIFMFAWQGGFKYHITTNASAKIAATLYNYIGRRRSSQFVESPLSPYYGDPYVGEGAVNWYNSPPYTAPGVSGYSPGTTFNGSLPGYLSLSFPFNQVGLNHLFVVEVPFEFNFRISRVDARVFGDFAYNLEGGQRAEDAASAYAYILKNTTGAKAASFSPQKSDVKAYQVGLDIGSRDSLGLVSGSTSRRHAWEVKTYWQHIEQYSLDPNLLDTDFFEGRANMEGIYVAAAYSLTDNLIAAFRWGHASRINKLLGTGGSGQDIPQMNPINDFDIYQVDLTLRF